MIEGLTPRQNIWVVLSDLFLDTDITLSFDYIEREILASPFTLDEIDLILRDEVAPVCLPNLYCVAGEWAAFHHEWLIPKIESHLAKPTWWARFGRRRRARQLRQMVPEWPGLRARIAAKRTA